MAFSIEADVEKASKALDETNKGLTSIKKQILGIIGKGTVKSIKAVINGSDLEKRTGELSKAYRYKVKKTGNEANVFPKALNSDSTIYPKAMTLSYGHDGPTARARYWHIKALGFVQAGENYIESGAYEKDIDDMIEKQLRKYWGN